MAIRAHYITFALDEEGRPIPGATVTVRQQGTETNITETIYALDGVDATTKTNPFTANADGKIEFFLDVAKRVDVYVTKTGYTSQTITADVGKLDPTQFSLLDGGSAMAVRAGIDFQDAFILTDNAGANRTEVDLDYAGTAELADVAATEDAGADVKIPRGGHRHAHGSGYLPDAHHSKQHAINDGAHHTGTLDDAQIPATIARDSELHTQAHGEADHTGSAKEVRIRKTADQEVVSSTALVDDTVLQFPIGANEVWDLRIEMFFDAGAGGIDATVAAPAGASGWWSTVAAGAARLKNALGTEQQLAGSGSNLGTTISGVIVNGGTPGDVKFRFAQTASNADPCRVEANAFLIAHRIA